MLNGEYHPDGATLDDAIEFLGRRTLHRSAHGEAPLPIPFGPIYGPLAEMVRSGGWRMRHALIMAMATRSWLATRPGMLGTRRRPDLTQATSSGELRIGVSVGTLDLYARLAISRGVAHTANRITLDKVDLPDTLLPQCLDRRVGEVIGIDRTTLLADARIRRIDRGRRTTTFWLDLVEHRITIDEVIDA